MAAIASQITSLTIVYSTVYSDTDQRKHQSSASLAFVRVIHRWPVNYLHKWPVTRKMFPFDDVIMRYNSSQVFLVHPLWWYGLIQSICNSSHTQIMMTSSNANIFHVTGHLCRDSPITSEFPAQRPATRSFPVFFDLHLNKRLCKQWWGWWFEMPSCQLIRHCNDCKDFELINLLKNDNLGETVFTA